MNDCARREGVKNPERMDPIELKRAYLTPNSAFPAILDQTDNKAYMQGYQTAPTTFDLWTVKGTLTDFKPTKSNYRQGDAGEFLYVPEGGELKHDKIEDTKLPNRQLSTYGRQFTLTREAIINDDIEFVTSVPARYAASARRTLNKQVYSVIAKNMVIYDRLKLFDSKHKNLVTPGTKPSYDSIQDMIKKLMLMTNESGDPIASVPRYVLVPIGMGDVVRQIVGSPTLAIEASNGVITTRNNPLVNRGLEVIEDAYLNTLNDGSEIEWYLIADPSILPCIQIDYLNGQEMPTIQRMEYPGQLGWVWDIYLDWAVSVIDYRGIIKNMGSAT